MNYRAPNDLSNRQITSVLFVRVCKFRIADFVMRVNPYCGHGNKKVYIEESALCPYGELHTMKMFHFYKKRTDFYNMN